MQKALDQRGKLLLEALRSELLRMVPCGIRIEQGLAGFEAKYSVADGGGGLFGKKDAGIGAALRIPDTDGFENATSS
jgi:hypothetical protein